MDAEPQRSVDVEPDLPDHEDDRARRRTQDEQPEPDPVERAGLPDHERDEREGEDTAGGVQNP